MTANDALYDCFVLSMHIFVEPKPCLSAMGLFQVFLVGTEYYSTANV